MNYSKKHNNLFQEVVDFINDNTEMPFVIVSDAELEESDDALYEAPTASYVSKHSFFQRYGLIRVEQGTAEGQLVFVGIETGEEGDTMRFDTSELELGTLCEIADIIKERK